VGEAPKIEGSHGCLRRGEDESFRREFGASLTSLRNIQHFFIIIVVITIEFNIFANFATIRAVSPPIYGRLDDWGCNIGYESANSM